MVIAGDHVLGAKVGEGQQVGARDLLDVTLVTVGHAVGVGKSGEEQIEHHAGKGVQERANSGQPVRPSPTWEQ